MNYELRIKKKLSKFRLEIPNSQFSIFNSKIGMGLIEIIIGSSIITIGLVSIVTAYNYYLHIAVTNTPTIQASYLLEESIEVMRLLRDQSWTTNIEALSTSNTYYLTYNTVTNKWATTATNTFIDGVFERKINITNVYRDGNDDIDTSGALDSDTRSITATVSWRNGTATTSKTISAHLTNIHDN